MFGDNITRSDLPRAYDDGRDRLSRFCVDLEALLWRLCDDRDLRPRVQKIASRVKETDSVMRKVERSPKLAKLSEVHDLCGARIITLYLDDVAAVRRMIHEEFDVTWERDLRAAEPHAFGYQSLHLVGRLNAARRDLAEYRKYADLEVEFQVRTVLQHAWGDISRSLDYHSETEVPAEVRRKLFRVAALLETGDEIFEMFRSEVEEIRDQYTRKAASADWTRLPLNRDSLTAAWDHLPVQNVLDVAYAAGFGARTTRQLTVPSQYGAWRLISVATQARSSCLGHLARRMEAVGQYRSQLERLRQIAEEHGFTPVADVCDIIVLTILFEDPALRSYVATPFRGEIEAALDAVLDPGTNP
jgi:ppGpp synthetase/RelA/SpoT-type nucleotidyltranferase